MSTVVPLPVAINLAYWLYKEHPDIFNALKGMATSKGLGALGQDGDTSDFLPGIDVLPVDDTSTDVGNFLPSSSAGSITTSDVTSTISPDLLALPEPQLQTVSFDPSSLPTPDLVTASVNAAASSNVSPTTASNVGSVGTLLTTGLAALAGVTAAIYKAGTPQASTIATQASRAAAGVNPAAITYGYNAAGQLVPILQTPASAGIALSPQTLASLGIPAAWGPYVIPVGIGLIILVAIAGASIK